MLVAEGGVLVSLCRWDEAVEDWERALALAPAGGARGSGAARPSATGPGSSTRLGTTGWPSPWVEKAIGPGNGPATLARAMALNGAAHPGLSDRRLRAGRAARPTSAGGWSAPAATRSWRSPAC